jgi:hypothetical protein
LFIAPAVGRAQVGTPQRPVPPAPLPSVAMLQEMPDARETRNRLHEIFNQHPPSVREVLRIDPTLVSRADYMANYPMLAAFLAQHPEVAHNPAFFIGERQFDERNRTPTSEAFGVINRAVENLTMFLIVGTIAFSIIFLVRTLMEHRRWQRAMRAQNELQTKLIDRFSSSDDLIAYLQSPAGKALTEAPVLPQASTRPMNAPLSRIFWSLQSGIVVGALGLGLLFVSSTATNVDLGQMLYGVGVIVLTIGLGFTLSAVVSYFLSHRLGLVQPPARFSGEAPGS